MNRALDQERAGQAAAARRVMLALSQEHPHWDEPHVRLAELARRNGDLSTAMASYEAALDCNAGRPEALVALGVLKLQAGEPVCAKKLLFRACAVAPDRAEAWDALGLALLATGDAAEAETALARAQALSPGDFALALRRIEAATAAGRSETELVRLEVATLIDPLDVVQLTGRGVLLGRLGRVREAIDILEAAVALAPGHATPLLELCNFAIHSDDPRRAEALLREAIAVAPEKPILRNNLAVILMRLHRHTEARNLLDTLIGEQGPTPGFLSNLSNALVALGLQEEGLAAGRAAITAAPDLHLAWRASANALAYCGDLSAAALLEAHRGAARCLPGVATANFIGSRDLNRRLRVGLLSATLKTHPVGWLTIAGFEQLDSSAFEIVCLGPEAVGDPLQRRFRAAAAEWHDVDTTSPAATADAIRALSIDILIDLGGYGDRGMMPACAWRAAPVQVKWVGMQNHSTGMPAMDWFITDRWETPDHLRHLYSERLLSMPDGYVCYSPPTYAPDVGPLPALSRGIPTFGCFNNLAKITPLVLAAWARILREIPGARLVLKTHQFDEAPVRDRVRAAFAATGGDAARLELRGSSPHRTLLAQYNDIDIVLDPFPYTGGLTTCEALWMGVPTITLSGEAFAARHATSHLSNVGLADWVTLDLDGYCAQAISRVADIYALAELRAGLRDRVRRSPLCDAPLFGLNLGARLRSAWHSWCTSEGDGAAS